jgi:hypothetical protein
MAHSLPWILWRVVSKYLGAVRSVIGWAASLSCLGLLIAGPGHATRFARAEDPRSSASSREFTAQRQVASPAPVLTPTPASASDLPVIESSSPYSAAVGSGPSLRVTGRSLDQVSRVRLLPSAAESEAYEVYFYYSSPEELGVFVYDGVPEGRYALELCTAAGSCATQADALMLYDAGVVIGYVWPGSASEGQAADVYIYGRGLKPGVTVTIGGLPVSEIQVYNTYVMYVRSPAELSIGQYDVTASLSDVSSTMIGAFSVVDGGDISPTPEPEVTPVPTPDAGLLPTPAPGPVRIVELAPSEGSARTGLWAVVRGSNLDRVTSAQLLGSSAGDESYEAYISPAYSGNQINSEELWVFVPDSVPAGTYALRLCAGDGECALQADALVLYQDSAVAPEPVIIEPFMTYSAAVGSMPWLWMGGKNLNLVSRARLLSSSAEAQAYDVHLYQVSEWLGVAVHQSVPAGQYALELCTASGQCVTQADALTLYDVSMSISYVWPGKVGEDQSPDVYIYGQGLTSAVTVTIGGLPVSDINVYNSAVMSVRTPAGLPIGQYDVMATLSDTSSTMIGAFSVVGQLVEYVSPNRQVVSTSAEAYLYGYGFKEGVSVTIGGLPVADLRVYDSNNLYVRTSADLPVGVHDVEVRFAETTTVLPAAYTVIEEQSSDWFAQAETFWTSPAAIRRGDPVDIGLIVYRQGGDEPRQARVSFYQLVDDVPQLIGVVSTMLLAPGPLWHSIEGVDTSWVADSPDAEVTLMAVIETDGLNDDINPANNIVTRTITLLPSMPDQAAPHVSSVEINDGAVETSDSLVTVEVGVTNTASMMYLVEREFNAAAGLWTPVQTTGWIGYQSSYPMVLMGSSGLRYVQAWVSDEMGNISSNSGMAGINYNAAPEEILSGQVRMFRYPLAAGQTATITLETRDGDADLYVWNPDGSSAARSVADLSAVDQVVVAAAENSEYQVEVYGYETSTYRLSVEYGVGASRAAPVRAATTTKLLRDAPVVQPGSQPAAMMAMPNAPISGMLPQPISSMLPQPSEATPTPTPGSYKIYVPVLVQP